MTLNIISPSCILYSGEVDSVTLPGEVGSFTVLRNHASLISVLVKGSIKYRRHEGNEEQVEIKGGLVDVNNNVISVCVY